MKTLKFKYPCPSIKFYWNPTTSFTDAIHGRSALQHQSWAAALETAWPAKPNTLTLAFCRPLIWRMNQVRFSLEHSPQHTAEAEAQWALWVHPRGNWMSPWPFTSYPSAGIGSTGSWFLSSVASLPWEAKSVREEKLIQRLLCSCGAIPWGNCLHSRASLHANTAINSINWQALGQV